MTIWAIVPVKPLSLGKSRLSSELSDVQRISLNRRFLENTLEILQHLRNVEQSLVVSRDSAALAVAREFGARTLLEHGVQNLNVALERATVVARAYATRGVLVLPADLPLLTGDVLAEMIESAPASPSITIAPDRHEQGTNALLTCPSGVIKYVFGPGSFHRHLENAAVNEVSVKIVRKRELELDLDLPEDLEIYRNTVSTSKIPNFLLSKPELLKEKQ